MTPPHDAEAGAIAPITVQATYEWKGAGWHPAKRSSTTEVQVVPTPPSTSVALSDLPWLRATSGWNVPHANAVLGAGEGLGVHMLQMIKAFGGVAIAIEREPQKVKELERLELADVIVVPHGEDCRVRCERHRAGDSTD